MKYFDRWSTYLSSSKTNESWSNRMSRINHQQSLSKQSAKGPLSFARIKYQSIIRMKCHHIFDSSWSRCDAHALEASVSCFFPSLGVRYVQVSLLPPSSTHSPTNIRVVVVEQTHHLHCVPSISLPFIICHPPWDLLPNDSSFRSDSCYYYAPWLIVVEYLRVRQLQS